jgi:hypothetical protein
MIAPGGAPPELSLFASVQPSEVPWAPLTGGGLVAVKGGAAQAGLKPSLGP